MKVNGEFETHVCVSGIRKHGQICRRERRIAQGLRIQHLPPAEITGRQLAGALAQGMCAEAPGCYGKKDRLVCLRQQK